MTGDLTIQGVGTTGTGLVGSTGATISLGSGANNITIVSGESLGAVAGCFRSCVGRLVAGGGMAECLQDTCPDEYADFNECMTPTIAGGACDESFNSCVD